MVSGALASRAEDRGGIVCGVRNFLLYFGLGAEGMVVCVGHFGIGGDITVVCGAPVVEQPNPNAETRSPNQ